MEVFYDAEDKRGKRIPGKERKINYPFTWEGQEGIILSLYVCPEGLVLDFCFSLPLLPALAKVEMTVEGKKLQLKRLSGVVWYPRSMENENYDCEAYDCEADTFMEYYRCDENRVWEFCRARFLWTAKGDGEIRSLDLELKADSVEYTGDCFATREEDVGKRIILHHPVTREEYELEICGFQTEELSDNDIFNQWGCEYPRNTRVLHYRVNPELPEGEFQVTDTLNSDAPVVKHSENTGKSKSAVSVIGGADGSTAIFIAGKCREPKTHAAYSALHFQKTDAVEWRTVFHVDEKADLCLKNLLC